MGCSGCGKKGYSGNIMEQHKYMTDRQIKARLEVYKKRYCMECEKREKCNYQMYVECKKG
jgi:hypothetical protein